MSLIFFLKPHFFGAAPPAQGPIGGHFVWRESDYKKYREYLKGKSLRVLSSKEAVSETAETGQTVLNRDVQLQQVPILTSHELSVLGEVLAKSGQDLTLPAIIAHLGRIVEQHIELKRLSDIQHQIKQEQLLLLEIQRIAEFERKRLLEDDELLVLLLTE